MSVIFKKQPRKVNQLINNMATPECNIQKSKTCLNGILDSTIRTIVTRYISSTWFT